MTMKYSSEDDWLSPKYFSDKVTHTIDDEVKAIVDGCYEQAKAILTENIDMLHKCAELLVEKERISREEFEALFERNETASLDKWKKSSFSRREMGFLSYLEQIPREIV